MGNTEFWSALIVLSSNFITGLITTIIPGPIIKEKYLKILKRINILLCLFLLVFIVFHKINESQKINKVEDEITYFLKEQNIGNQSKALCEIIEHLKSLDYDESLYLKAITDMKKNKVLIEDNFKLYSVDNTQGYNCLVYSLKFQN